MELFFQRVFLEFVGEVLKVQGLVGGDITHCFGVCVEKEEEEEEEAENEVEGCFGPCWLGACRGGEEGRRGWCRCVDDPPPVCVVGGEGKCVCIGR